MMRRHYDAKPLVTLIKSCNNLRSLENLHSHIREKGLLQKDVYIGNTLIDTYSKCSCLTKAQQVFDELPYYDVVSWNVLIAGYVKHDHGREALSCFKKMQLMGFPPNTATYLSALKACSKISAINKVKQIHAEISGKGFLLSNLILGNAVIDAYAKCGMLMHAQEAFYNLPSPDVISWNVLITGYTRHESHEKALECYRQMQSKGIPPNSVTFMSVLKAIGRLKAINLGMELHDTLQKRQLQKELVVSNALIDMYTKCGCLGKAKQVFDEIPVRDVISWTALIAGYVDNAEEALKHFEQMRTEGITPNAFTFVSALKACCSGGSSQKGMHIHAEISGDLLLESDCIVGNVLVHLYAKCGYFIKAQEVFAKLPVKDIISWNALIGGYCTHNFPEQVLSCIKKMEHLGVFPNVFTYCCILRACSSIGLLEKGIEAHAEIVRKGLLEDDHGIGIALIDMYCNCGFLGKACEVFDMIPDRNVIAWTTLIAGYAKRDFSENVLFGIAKMQLEGFVPDSVTLLWGLKACAKIGALDEGITIHAEILRIGRLEKDVFIGSALVDMYSKCYSLKKAQEVFDMLLVRDVVSWNSLISAYTEHGYGEKALNCYDQMRQDGVPPDAVTFLITLKACGQIGAVCKGQEIHEEVFREGLLHRDPAVGNAIMNMYGECGFLREAVELFDTLPTRDIVSWNTVIARYANKDHGEEAIDYFNRMQHEGVAANYVTFLCILKACSAIRSGNQGRDIHAEISKYGLEEGDMMVGNALINMYCRCGMLEKARDLFDKLRKRDVISWTSLIIGYTALGQTETVVEMFERMIEETIAIDSVTFVCILTACAHAGFVDKGETYFKMMKTEYGISPTLQHYTCMIDLLGRAGHFKKLLMIIKDMPFPPDLVTWQTVLNAGQKWGTLEIGKMLSRKQIDLLRSQQT